MAPFSHLMLGAAALAIPAQASVLVAQSVEELARAAPVIVRATVGPSQAAWDTTGRIWTWTELRVTETLKGATTPTLLVKQPGGEVGAIGQAVAGVARFVEGQDCLLFLDPAPDGGGVFIPTALSAAKVDFIEGPSGAVAVRNLEGLAFAQRGQRSIRPAEPSEHLGRRDDFLLRVRAAVRRRAQ